MKPILTAVLAAMLVIPVRADEQAPAPAPAKSSWSDFLRNMKTVLSQSAVAGERKKSRGAAVAAVRGPLQDKKQIADPNETGLRGDAKSAKARRELAYDAELEASIDLLSKGKLEEGLAGLEAFKAAHPKYRNENVDTAIAGAKTAIAESKGAPAEGAPAAQAAAKP